MHHEKLSVAQARLAESVGQEVLLQGWIRTRRDSKGGFSFLELNDGSSFGNIQVVAPGTLPNYESDIKRLTVGCSVSVEGLVKASPGKGQATEVEARSVTVHGWADPEPSPSRRKGPVFEFLRTVAHLRPRTNTFGAMARVRNCVCRSIHDFFQEEGFLYVHTPIITASDCEGAGAMFQVTTLDLGNPPLPEEGLYKPDWDVDFTQGLLPAAGLPDRQRAAWRPRPTPARWASATPSAPPSAPRTPTRPGTWPSSGWSSRRWPSSN